MKKGRIGNFDESKKMIWAYLKAKLQNSYVLNFSFILNLVSDRRTEQLYTDDKRLSTDDAQVQIQQPIIKLKTWKPFGRNNFNHWTKHYMLMKR